MNKSEYVYEEKNDWKTQAEAFFFIEHLKIKDIAIIVKKARETVSRYISDCEGYDEEMAFRRKQSEVYNKNYKRQWDRMNRVDGDSIRREHIEAVGVLSHERI